MKKIAVFVSGNGSNLQQIIEAIDCGNLPQVHLSLVVANRSCFALDRAKNHYIPTYQLNPTETLSSQLDRMIDLDTDLIVLAGFLAILPDDFCSQWEGKIINIHPSLLPKHGGKGMYGAHVHRAVLAQKERQSGATVHYVTSAIDQGKIILQEACAIANNETLASLQEKISLIEHRILIQAIQKVLNLTP